jgi:ribosomal protein S27E
LPLADVEGGEVSADSYPRSRFLQDLHEHCGHKSCVFVHRGWRIWTCNKCTALLHIEDEHIGVGEVLAAVRKGWQPKPGKKRYRRPQRFAPYKPGESSTESFTDLASRLVRERRDKKIRRTIEHLNTESV